MKKISYFLVSLLAVCLVSCGNDKTVTLKLEPELGSLGAYLSVNDTEVTVTHDEDSIVKASLSLNVIKSVAAKFSSSFELEVKVLDKNHVEIASLPDFEIETEHDNDFNHYLSIGSIRAEMNGYISSDDWNKIQSDGAYISVKPSSLYPEFQPYKGSAESDESDDSVTATADDNSDVESTDADESESAGSEDWDELLDEYDQYTTQMISFLKKASNGDPSAMTEYQDLLQKAQGVGEKMSGAQGEMTAAQWARYMKITQKMTRAAQQL
jgi:hypothetical protein